MKIYTVHTLAWSAADDGDAVFVKEGFCWPGFVFGIFWSLWHGMWMVSAALFGIALVAGLAVEAAGLNDAAASLVQLFLHLGVGVFGNDLRRWSLRRGGFVESGIVAAARGSAAEQRYFDTRLAGTAR